MKYILMMFGDQASMAEMRSAEWIHEMIQFMQTLNAELEASGELVAAIGLVDPSQAKTVRIAGAMPVSTDGPFAESKESLAGYWIVDVADEARALAIAEHVVAFTEGPLEVRAVADGPPPDL
ncbi:MAG: hypothetical protein QOG52_2653 [Frankiaceae bacterium]|jgi:hypothetical protein|nr:hypothetical protein [Frankiaceae bacterium]